MSGSCDAQIAPPSELCLPPEYSRASDVAKFDFKVSFASISDPDIKSLDLTLPEHTRLLEESFISAYENARMIIALSGASISLAVVSSVCMSAVVADQGYDLQPILAAAFRLLTMLSLVGDLLVGLGITNPCFIFHFCSLTISLIFFENDDNILSSEMSTTHYISIAVRTGLACLGALASLRSVLQILIPN